MKKYFWLFLLITLNVGFLSAQLLPSNFNNQSFMLKKIEQDMDLVKNLNQNILENSGDSPQLRNDLVIAVLKKEMLLDEITQIMCTEFLQKYILSTDPEINIKLSIAHKILNLCFILKSSLDVDISQELDTEIQLFKEHMKLNYQVDPEYKPWRKSKYQINKKE